MNSIETAITHGSIVLERVESGLLQENQGPSLRSGRQESWGGQES